MTNKRRFDDDQFDMSSLRKEFLVYLNQPEYCENFYTYMKSEDLAHLLEFYLACDGLQNLRDEQINPKAIIHLIYKHYLSSGKDLSSSKIFSLPDYLLLSIKQRLNKHEYHIHFYDQAQEYVFKYMLQMCYPKFLIEQKNSSHRRRKKSHLSSSEGSTDNAIKISKIAKTQYNLAQQNPSAFFHELKTRLVAYQTKKRSIDDDPSAILDIQIAKTIDHADNYLYEHSFQRYDSGVATDSSEKNYETSIDVIWYPSLDSPTALLSTISLNHSYLTFKEFRQLFKKQLSYRYFFKTICTPDIHKDQYVYREITMDDELIPFYDGKIFVQLDRQ